MNDKLIRLRVPAIDLRADAFVPEDITVTNAITLLSDVAASMAGGFYHPTGSEILCIERLDEPLRPDQPLSAYGLQNSDCLVLI